MTRRYVVPLIVLVVALAALGGSISWAAMRDDSRDFSMMRLGSGMMGYADAGSGEPVRDLAAAKARAQRFAERLDLRVGEVMRFDNHFYAELVDGQGRGATEVLVDPDSGSVVLEPGPAMMWNTRYGMMRGSAGTAMMASGGRMGAGGMMGGDSGWMGDPTWTPRQGDRPGRAEVTVAEATTIAARWLKDHDPALRAGEAEPFPGYFTLHTMRGWAVDGMLSVNASTGAVWYHWWHGRFVEMSE